MSQSFVDEQKSSLIAALSQLYRPGQLIKAGTKTSDGRGGYTGTTTTFDVQIQREDLSESLTKRNIAPDEALIFMLNDGSAIPSEGDALVIDGKSFMISMIALDPAGTVFECVCENG